MISPSQRPLPESTQYSQQTDLHRTPLDELSAHRRDLYLRAHNTHNRQTSIGLIWTSDQPVAQTSTCTTHNTHNRQTSIGLLWTSDQPVAQTSTCTTHNTHNRQTSTPTVGFEPTISAGERPQTHVLHRRPLGPAHPLYYSLCNSQFSKQFFLISNKYLHIPFLYSSFRILAYYTKLNSMALVRERTIPTERPPPVGEVGANFYG